MSTRTYLHTGIGSLALATLVGLFTFGCSSDAEAGLPSSRYAPPTSGYYDAGVAQGMDAGAAFDENVEPEPIDDTPVVNPFTATGHDPFSTFAADVDTASYDLYLQHVTNYGALPQPTTVRVEEFINSFDYEYTTPAADAEVPFAIDLSMSEHPMGRARAMLRVGIQAAAPPELERLPTNLVYLVDVSGSMNDPQKLPLVKEVILASLETLDASDTVSIVTYAGSTRVALGPTSATETERIADVIRDLESGGGTAGGAGIQLAYEQAAAGFIEGGFNHVVLCTDGDFNIGISDTDALIELIEEKRETGVTLTALGFGRVYRDDMMERVSNAGNGIYSVIYSRQNARDYGSYELFATVTHVAKDMKIQVEFNPEIVHAYRLLGYENRAIPDELFRDDTVDAGEVGAGHRVTALYEIIFTGQELPAGDAIPELVDGEPVEGQREISAGDIVLVKVRWKQLAATPEDPAEEVSASLTPDDVRDALSADEDILWASAMAAYAEILRMSPYASYDDLTIIQEIVDAQRTRDDERQEFAQSLSTALPLIEHAYAASPTR